MLSQSRAAGARRLSRRTYASGLPPSTSPRGPVAPPPPPTPSNRLWLSANPAFGQSDISRRSCAVHGSPFLASAILDFSPAVAGDFADQVATKTVSGSRLNVFFSGLLRCDTQREQRSSNGCGDLEAGGRTSAAGRRVRVRFSLDAVFREPKNSSHKMSAPTVFSPIDAQAESGFLPTASQAGSGFLPADVEAASGFSLIDARATSGFSPVDAQTGSGLSPCRIKPKEFSRGWTPEPKVVLGRRKLRCKHLLARRNPSRSVLSTSPQAHNGARHHLRHSRPTASKLLALISSGLNPSEPENRIETEPSPNSSASR